MLKQRLLTAMIGLPLVVAVIGIGPVWVYITVLSSVIAWAAWEWCQLVALNQRYLVVFLVSVGVSFGGLLVTDLAVPICWLAVGFWIPAFACVLTFAKLRRSLQMLLEQPWVKILLGWVLIMPFGAGVWYLKQINQAQWLLFLLVLIWGADTAAYFGGRRWGRHALAPALSPGKTWEGFLASVTAAAILAAGMLSSGMLVFDHELWLGLALVILVIVIAALGDLFESGVKRLMGVKDSGRGLPGHGGILDRIDSLTSAVPFFVVSQLLLGH